MSTSEVQLQPEKILEHARDVMKLGGWSCEWNIGPAQKPTMCRIMLASWNAYMKHLLYHCKEQCKHSKPPFTCHLPRCNLAPGMNTMSSFNELAKHVQHSHLNRAHLQCPIKDCNSSTFSRSGMLESHFKESHPDLLNKTVHVPSPFLLPLWRPFSPLHHDPLPLPTHVPPGLTLIPPVKGSWRTQPRTPRRIEEARIASPKRKKHGPQIPDVKADVKEDAEHEEIEFEDLPKQLDSGGSYAWEAERECVLQSVGPPVDVARPQPILDPNIFGYRIPRKSILYDAFVELHIAEWDMDDEEEPEDDSQLTVTEIRLHPNTGHGSQIPSSSRVASQADN